MPAFDWFKERSEFNLNYAKKFLDIAKETSANAVGAEEKMLAEQAIEEADIAIQLLSDAIATGNTDEGQELEREGLEAIRQCELQIKLAEDAKANFANKP
ncbi:hypothetical protein [Pararhizobium sp. DWP3-4]|uniref:hypothetical protein n=1 Tax=unclassified Pararhizobium TaxID=2643050 RepID=UPI003CF2A846